MRGLARSVLALNAAAPMFTKADFTGPFQFVDRFSESTRQEWEVTSQMGVQVMDRVLPEDSVVGSWDAGVIGYFSRFPVVNLDGLVNSYDYLRAQKEGTEAAFHSRYGITHFANLRTVQEEGTKRLEHPSVSAILFKGSSYLHYGKNGLHKRQFRLRTAEPPEMSSGGINRSDWFWQRMEPHFDYQSEGIGLIVDGRLAQAFVRNCAPDELAVWSWAGQKKEAVVKAWAQTQTGLCVAAAVLPNYAFPPLHIEKMTASDYLADLVGDRQPAIRADFDVYLSENSLIYAKEQCKQDDLDAMFFLHLDPVDVNDLPSQGKQHGFDNLDFNFDERGAIFDGKCLAEIPLPEYAISEIRTGQYVLVDSGYNHLWEGKIRLNE